MTPEAPHSLALDLEGERISVAEFLDATREFLTVLRAVDAEVTEHPRGTLEWQILELSAASVHLRAAATPVGEATPLWAQQTVPRLVVAGLAEIERRGTRPPFFSDAALAAVLRLTALTSSQRIRRIIIRSNGSEAQLGRALAENVQELVGETDSYVGSVEGTLEAVSIHRRRYFNVYDFLSGQAVRCEFKRKQFETVRSALGKRVIVSGEIFGRRTGERLRILVRDLEILADREELPSAEDVRGILRDG